MALSELSRRIGLARALSKLGYCSRSHASELIRAGRVRLNSRVHHNPEAPVRLNHDKIEVDGRGIDQQSKIYLLVNKPRGLVTTATDEKGRKTVYDVFRKQGAPLPWVAPVGRLDKASEGLLLLTNDSSWGARIASPETHLHKVYHVQVGGIPDEAVTQTMERGVQAEGELLRAIRCRYLRSGERNCWLEITLDEGKNRQIRRMLAAFDFPVLRLVRVAIGPLKLGGLAKGEYRHLTVEEKAALDGAINRVGPNKPRDD